MNRVTYIYSGPNADAARYLLTHSALAHVTETTPDAPWHGANATKVELLTPSPSHGELALWHTLEDLARAASLTLHWRHIDDANREVLVEALRIALLATVDLALDEQQVTA